MSSLIIHVILFATIVSVIDGSHHHHHHHSPYISDVCDWQGSGSPNVASDRSVVPIYLRCSRGSVQWLYPKGGLRVVLKLGTNNKEFRGCIRVARNSTKSVRIYIEGKRQLHQIYAPDDGKHEDLFRCFVSVHAFMALFIETDPNENVTQSQDHVLFHYDLQASNNTKAIEDDYEECKPCSDDEILAMFCSADFVLSGKVTYFYQRPEVQMTEFNVKPTFVHRFPIKSAYINDLNVTEYSTNEMNNNLTDETTNNIERVTLNRPLKCASRATARADYLFLGRRMLGNYMIRCAPKLSHWKLISKQALERGTNQCHLM
ncbi:hypothetical protein BLOT_014591 [Blomia tropicalis]|nr:hypothetical protein BLOT_014591 [Blomia tropicalis]